MKLTAKKVERAGPGMYGDGDGLWLRVVSVGRRTWVLRYQRQGKAREMGLGSFRAISLAQARETAQAQQRLLAQDIDPIEHRRAQQNASARITFAEACDSYITAYAPGWGRKHCRTWRSTLDLACKTIGAKPVDAVGTEDLLKVLQPLWIKTTVTASRLRGRIELVLSYATVRGWRDRNVMNPAIWRGHLQLLLPASRKVRAIEHYAALPWQETPAFMQALQQHEGFGAAALQFAIVTATRSGEVRGARWEEIDLDAAVWTIPASRMKARREHRVPLSELALTILHKMAGSKDGSGLVFLGRKHGETISDMTLRRPLWRLGHREMTVHGFRSTFRDWAAEATHHPNHVVEQALAHAIGSAVEAAYRRGDLFEKRKALMDDWAAYLAKQPAKVLPIRPAVA